ncbi:MAG: hypothetical protein HQM08_19810 [Candidatus Riflebacteria bacterium]|nr:hypothetical protein [Candidatus Riflebacteria bacterium]
MTSLELPRIVSHDFGDQRFSLLGRVPHACTDRQVVLVAGQIFNAAELADKLYQGTQDVPHLLLHAYLRWGAGFPRYLEGEFAFALWDGFNRRLLLGRDPIGSRPLFYLQQGGDFCFSGEIHTLLAGSGARVRANESHIAHWLALIPNEGHSTFFENVFEVPPGQTLCFENGRVAFNTVWHPDNIPALRLRDSREYADGLREVLKTAIRDRLPAEGIVGSQLSGGLDSSSVTALAAGILQPHGRRLLAFTAVPKFTVTIPGRICDEGPLAASVAARYANVDHFLVSHGRHSIFSMIDRYSSAQMEPVFNPSNYDWIHEICLQARQRGATTLLASFAGNMTISYDGALALTSCARHGQVFLAARLARDAHRHRHMSWRGIAFQLLIPWLPVWAQYSLDRLRGKFSGTFDYSMMGREFAQANGIEATARHRSIRDLNSSSLRLWIARRANPGAAHEAFTRFSGVTMTDPTADKRVVEYCFSVPLEHFCKKGVPRSLIRDAMAGLLPEQVRTGRVRGIQAADFGQHFRAERQEALDEIARMKRVDLAARALDLPAMENMLHWSEARIASEGIGANYRSKLTRGLSLGRFLRRLEDGTLFTPPEATTTDHSALTAITRA